VKFTIYDSRFAIFPRWSSSFSLPAIISSFCILHSAFAQTILEAPGIAAFHRQTSGGGGGGGLPCTPDYGNTGGTGNRTSLITVSGDYFGSSGFKMVDGNTTSAGQGFFPDAAVAGKAIVFDFGAGKAVLITEVKYYQQNTTSQGTWKWQGSNDNSTWTDIGSSFALGGVATQTITTLSGNTSTYRYYRMLGISGNSSSNPWLYEFEFKICGL
jgi:hypothetical protein